MKLNFKEFLQNEELAVIGPEMSPAVRTLIYQHYAKTYQDAGHNPWSKQMFDSKHWQAAGIFPKVDATGTEINPESVGLVTYKDKNGILKLTGMIGPNAMAKVRGLKEIVGLNKPIWGAMDKDFTERLEKMGFSTPPKPALDKLYPIIKNDSQFSSGGEWGEMNPDGGINFELGGVGATVKYFTANKLFYRYFLDKNGNKLGLNHTTLSMLKTWNSQPDIVKSMAMPSIQAKGFDEATLNWMVSILSDEPAKPSPKPIPAVQKQPAFGQQPTPTEPVGQAAKTVQADTFK